MKLGILGTGHAASLLASAWANAGHEITLGSRDPGAKRLDFSVKTLADTVRWADVVVNATPLGMKEDDPLPFDIARISPHTFVGEVVMKSEYTPFLRAARGLSFNDRWLHLSSGLACSSGGFACEAHRHRPAAQPRCRALWD